MIKCPVCKVQFNSSNLLSLHFRNKRKNPQHAEYINRWVKASFHRDYPIPYLLKHHLCFSRQSLNEKWKKWYSPQERKDRAIRVISVKNSGYTASAETKRKISEKVKEAYRSGRKVPPMKGKVAHNKGVPCSLSQRKKISETLRKKYASGEISICNNGNNFYYGYRKGIKHFCRSSWEANIARMLIFYDIDYEYEKFRFKLEHNAEMLTYIPDFWLCKQKTFLEVKGRYLESSKLKHVLFKQQYPQHKIAILIRKKYFKIERKLCRIIPDWELSRRNIDIEKYLIRGNNEE